MDTGWIKIHRKIMKWEWYQEGDTFRIFFHLLLNANHEDKNYRGIIIERGQLITGRHKLHEQTGISERSIRTSLKRLKTTNEITIKTTNHYSIITICNYNNYQINIYDTDQHYDQQAVQQATSKRPASDHKQEVKEVKNEKKKELKDIYTLIISHLNSICNTNYRPASEKNTKLIKARIQEGFTIEDFQVVIEKKYAEWGSDEKMSKFLRPETLFGTKFESYLNQIQAVPKKSVWQQIMEDEYGDEGNGQDIIIPTRSIS